MPTKYKSRSNTFFTPHQMAKTTQNIFTSIGEINNHQHYKNPNARVIAGFTKRFMQIFHTNNEVINISAREDDRGEIFAFGPHRIGAVEGALVTSAIKFERGVPRFWAATDFNAVPFAKWLLEIFETIPIEISSSKDSDEEKERKKTANRKAMQATGDALLNGNYLFGFPQGEFSRKNTVPPFIQDGLAIIAVDYNVAIHVMRLDGDFWSLKNWLFPKSWIDHPHYRAIATLFFPNNIKIRQCTTIDFHLKEECTLDRNEKIKQINAIMYAYYDETLSLEQDDIDNIAEKISKEKHLDFYEEIVKLKEMKKEIRALERDEKQNQEKLKDLKVQLKVSYEKAKAEWKKPLPEEELENSSRAFSR